MLIEVFNLSFRRVHLRLRSAAVSKTAAACRNIRAAAAGAPVAPHTAALRTLSQFMAPPGAGFD